MAPLHLRALAVVKPGRCGSIVRGSLPVSGWGKSASLWVPALVLAGGLVGYHAAHQPSQPAPAQEAQPDGAAVHKFVTQHCISCHNGDDKRVGLALDGISAEDVGKHAAVWKKVVRKV